MAARILILQLKRIGDCILTAPAIAALHAAQPDAEIVLVTPDSVAELAACFVGVTRVLPYRQWSFNLRAWTSVLAGVWDACYDFTGTDRSALMTKLSRATQRHGYAKFAKGLRAKAYTHLCDAIVRELHTVDFHLALIGSRAISGPSLQIPAETSRGRNAPTTSPYAVVHIGTAREEKFWPAERWAEIINQLAGTHHVVLTGTNAGIERPHLDQLRSLLKAPITDLTGQLSLVQLASVIEHCDLALGVDSMAMHLAALFEKPQVVLFGPTNPFHWRPRHARAVVLAAGHDRPVETFQPKAKGAPMELISTQMVVDAIRRALIPVSWPNQTNSK
jgi:ADP-heptose:LPS heptosyltransferase